MNPETSKAELKKTIEKYGLPELSLVDKEIEIIDLLSERRELPQNMLSLIRRRFTDVIYGWINFLHSFIVPNPQSLIVNKDAEAFDEKEKEDIYKQMTLLAKMTRESARFEIKKKDEKAEAKFINDNFKKYMDMKPKFEEFNKKVIDFWQKEIEQCSK